MTTLPKRLNQLSDVDWGWWPIVRLRPKKEEAISTKTLLLLTSIFGSAAALGMLAFRLVRYRGVSLMDVGIAFVLGWLLFFLVYRITFARAWNARAEELRRQL